MPPPRKKTGRPKLAPSEKRTKALYVRLTPAEHRRFRQLAASEPPTYVARRIILRWMREVERAGVDTLDRRP
jgi:hypothetical protein